MKKRELKDQITRLRAEMRAMARSAVSPSAPQPPKGRPTAAKSKPEPEPKSKRRVKISETDLARSRIKPLAERQRDFLRHMFAAAKPPPGVVPKGSATLAADARLKAASEWAVSAFDSQQIIFAGGWAGTFGGGQGYGPFSEGLAFLGYPYLAELAQRPEYRVITETTATQMTRKGIKVKVKGSVNKDKEVDELEEELERLEVVEMASKAVEGDGYYGRSHLYLDFKGATDDRDELKTPVGDGQNAITRVKVERGSLERILPVEAVWCYPTNYNSNDPLKPDWYRPQMWFAMGKEVHASRLLTYVGREVPDLLKPAYSFGGLSMSQMAKPYVDNWLRTRQSVSDLLHSFSVFHLSTDMAEVLQPGGNTQLDTRIQFFNNIRDNKGLVVLDKDSEEFGNVSVPLGTLDALQAQSQEHMCSVSRTPAVILTGISPKGLNATSEGEIRVYHEFIAAQQKKRAFKGLVDRMFHFAQYNLWGRVDPDLTYEFEPLWSLNEKEEAEVRKIEAETDDILITTGIIDAPEARARVANDPDTPYQGLDLNKLITPPDYGTGNSGELENLHNAGEGGGGGGSFSEAAE